MPKYNSGLGYIAEPLCRPNLRQGYDMQTTFYDIVSKLIVRNVYYPRYYEFWLIAPTVRLG